VPARRPMRDQVRERRIEQEIVVDTCDPNEQAMGWYRHLEDALGFPFTARCTGVRASSPLQAGDEVDVVGMTPVEECGHEMFVLIRWERGTLGVPLSQLDAATGDAGTREAVQDWRSWVERGRPAVTRVAGFNRAGRGEGRSRERGVPGGRWPGRPG
jgi:Calcium binding